jgi:hypothetical protein
MPNIFNLNISSIKNSDNILAGNEYKIIIGFPKSSGIISDFKITVIIDDNSSRIIIVNMMTILLKPILINGKRGIIGGISISNRPIIIVNDSKSAVYAIFRII